MIATIYISHYIKRIMQLAIIAFLFYLIYFFYQPGIDLNWFYVPNPIYDFTQSINWRLYLIVYAIIICFINIVAFSSLSLFFDYTRNKSNRNKKIFEELLTQKMVDYLFDESDAINNDNIIKELKPLLKSKSHLASFFRVTKKIKETIDLDLNTKMMFIVNELKLKKKLRRFLFSYNVSDKILALEIISALEIKDYKKEISSFFDKRNHALRTEAIATIIKLSDFDYLFQTINKNHDLSTFDMNVIINTILQNDKLEIDYSNLLSSPYPTVATIGVKIVKERKLNRYKEDIKKLIESDNQLLKLSAWEAFISFAEENECVNFIIDHYAKENDKIKQTILKESAHFTSETYSNFLRSIIKERPLLEKVDAMKILFQQNFNLLLEYRNSTEVDIQKAYQEVIDFYNLN